MLCMRVLVQSQSAKYLSVQGERCRSSLSQANPGRAHSVGKKDGSLGQSSPSPGMLSARPPLARGCTAACPGVGRQNRVVSLGSVLSFCGFFWSSVCCICCCSRMCLLWRTWLPGALFSELCYAICGKRSPISFYVFAFAASKAGVATVAAVADVHQQRHVASLIPKHMVWIPLFHVD